MTESLPSGYLAASVGVSVSPGYSIRPAVVSVLRAASDTLAHLACKLSAAEVRRETAAATTVVSPLIEFYAEAGAAEGALYVDGKLLGYLPGVARL